MDRKSLIGFLLMVGIAVGYFYYSTTQSTKLREEKRIEDSIADAKRPKVIETIDSTKALQDTVAAIAALVDSTTPPALRKSTGTLTTLSNGKISIKFNTKGAAPQTIGIDSYQTYRKTDLLFADGEKNAFNIILPYNGSTIQTNDLMFEPTVTNNADGSTQLVLATDLGSGKSISYTYTLPKDSYMIQAQLHIKGMQADLNGATSLPLEWTTEALSTEKDIKVQRMNAQVHYLLKDKEYDYFTVEKTPSNKIAAPLKWMSVRTHFFNSTLIADNEFTSGSFDGVIDADNKEVVYTVKNELGIPVQASNDVIFGFKWLVSPNDYYLLKSYDLDLDEMIHLGFGIFFFVKYISKWLTIPIFTFLTNHIGSVALCIILLTVIIRAFLSFFTYKSYLSNAKMRALKPEIEKLKEKHGDDQQAMSMAQMKLYQTAGVNPLGGCLPLLLQMPFLLSMYYFFPTSLTLRQSSFMWADDLSTYDEIVSWTGNIPVISSILGNHLSLFTLLMSVTSILVALYNRNNQPTPAGGNDMNMKMMQYMPFIMPILFIGWFNNFAAGLTFYYTFSNILSIVQQFIINKFMINEKTILANIEKKRNEPAKTSKWQSRLEEMQKLQQEKMKQQGK